MSSSSLFSILTPGFVGNGFRKLLDDPEKRRLICDATLSVSSPTESSGPHVEEVLACRSVLAVASDVFEAQFYGPMSSESETIEIACSSENEHQAFVHLIEYCHFGELRELSTSLLVPLLYLSDKYLIISLKTLLEDEAIKITNEETALELYSASLALELEKLENKSWGIIQRNAEALFREGDIERLPFHVFKGLVKKRIRGVSEYTLYRAICRWMKERDRGAEEEEEEGEGREENVRSMVMECVDFLALSAEELVQVIQVDQILDFATSSPILLYSMLAKSGADTGLVEQGLLASFSEETKLGARLRGISSHSGGMGVLNMTREEFLQLGWREANIPTHFPDRHDGGSAFDPVRNQLWSVYGNENDGRVLHCVDLESRAHQTFQLPIGTHEGYPIYYDDCIYVTGGKSGFRKRSCRIHCVSHEIVELSQSTFDHGGFSIPCIQSDRLWVATVNNKLAFYDFQVSRWEETTVRIGKQAAIVADRDQDKLWIVDDEGLKEYVISTNTCRVITAVPKQTNGANFTIIAVHLMDETLLLGKPNSESSGFTGWAQRNLWGVVSTSDGSIHHMTNWTPPNGVNCSLGAFVDYDRQLVYHVHAPSAASQSWRVSGGE